MVSCGLVVLVFRTLFSASTLLRQRHKGISTVTVFTGFYDDLGATNSVCVVQVPDGCSAALSKSFFDSTPLSSVTSAVTSAVTTEVCTRHLLSPGNYRVVPYASEPNVEADFLLRVFTKTSSHLVYDVFSL